MFSAPVGNLASEVSTISIGENQIVSMPIPETV